MSAPQAEAMAEPEKQMPTGTVRVDRDAALVEGLRRGDQDAPEHLLETYGDRVYRLAIRITGNEQDAEEVVQDALWTAARKIDTFKGESAFGSWVYRITANAAYQKLRSRQGQRNEISMDAVSPGFDELGQHAEPLRDWRQAVPGGSRPGHQRGASRQGQGRGGRVHQGPAREQRGAGDGRAEGARLGQGGRPGGGGAQGRQGADREVQAAEELPAPSR